MSANMCGARPARKPPDRDSKQRYQYTNICLYEYVVSVSLASVCVLASENNINVKQAIKT